MAISVKSLADGQLANTKTTLYACPSSTTAIVRLISYVNTGAGARTVNLYLKPSGGTSRRLIPVALSLAAGNSMEYTNVITLEAADVLEGDASTAAEVDYVIEGVERTV